MGHTKVLGRTFVRLLDCCATANVSKRPSESILPLSCSLSSLQSSTIFPEKERYNGTRGFSYGFLELQGVYSFGRQVSLSDLFMKKPQHLCLLRMSGAAEGCLDFIEILEREVLPELSPQLFGLQL